MCKLTRLCAWIDHVVFYESRWEESGMFYAVSHTAIGWFRARREIRAKANVYSKKEVYWKHKGIRVAAFVCMVFVK